MPFKRMLRRIRSFAAALILLIAFILPSPAVYAATPDMPLGRSKGAILMESSTRQILRASDDRTTFAPRGLVNYLTVLTAFRHSELEATITVPADVADVIPEECYVIYLRPGEVVTVRDCIVALLFNDANDAAYALAAALAGSTDVFVEWMNETAAACGAEASHFVTIYDLDTAEQYSTVQDMALILSAVSREDKLMELIGKDVISIPPTNLVEETRYYANEVPLLQTVSDYYLEYAVGGRYNNGCVAVFAHAEQMDLVCVAYGLPDMKAAYEAAYQILSYGYAYFQPVTITFDETSLSRLPVYTGDKKLGYAAVRIEGSLTFYAESLSRKPSDPEGLESFFTHELTLPDRLEAPVRKGDRVGQVVYTMKADPRIQVELPCTVQNDFTVPKESIVNKVTSTEGILRILTILHWILIPVLVILLIILLWPWVKEKFQSDRGI
ncbi:MAG: hypothetical protein IJM90_04030 [Firmicutes bacterium]|nr:hypothetical protein [Bacillota bacterium]